MKVSILTPYYWPELNFFNSAANSDLVILLDDMDLASRSKVCRTRIIGPEQVSEWLIVSAKRSQRSSQKINKVELDDSSNWKKKQLKRTYHSYKQSLYFDEIYPLFEEMVYQKRQYLFEMNLDIIRALLQGLQISCDIKLASEMNVENNAPKRHLELFRASGGTELNIDTGYRKYLNEKDFEDYKINVNWLNYKYSKYDQNNKGRFIPGLSVLDPLFNCGKMAVHFFLK